MTRTSLPGKLPHRKVQKSRHNSSTRVCSTRHRARLSSLPSRQNYYERFKKFKDAVLPRLPPRFYLSLHLAENIIEEQEDAQDIQRRIQILELAHHHLDQYITQNAEADAIGDAVAEHHRNHRDKGRE